MPARFLVVSSLLCLTAGLSRGQVMSTIPNPSNVGQSVTLVAYNVSSGGEVYFFDITNPASAIYLAEAGAMQGTATVFYTFQNPGVFQLTACNTLNPSDPSTACAPPVQQTVLGTGTVTLTASPNPPNAGQPVTLTATVSVPGTTNPPGSIAFYDGTKLLGVVRLAGGSASLTTSFSAGAHNLMANWDGGNVYAPASGAASLTVTSSQAPTTTSLSVSLAVVTTGQPVTLTAAVSPSGATGTVTFLDAGVTTIGIVTLSGGTAALTTSSLPPGSHSITASYSGDSNYSPSVSSAQTVTVSVSQACGTDLAAFKSAAQSSTLTSAALAVDCNTDGAFYDGSVSSTNLDSGPPWWQVDLGASTAIGTIAIWNRTDCCGSRLTDYWIFVSDTPFGATDTPGTLQSRPGTFAIHQTTAPSPSTSITVTAQGRYVRVQLSDVGYLTLAEVQIFGPATNTSGDLAQGKAASQSSTLPGTPPASAAVDGNTDGYFFDGSVTATNLDTYAWWQVDLGSSTPIGSVKVWNRVDCCGDRLSDFWVFVSDTPFLASDTPANLQSRAGTFASHQTSAPTPFTTITGMTGGRYVRVQLSGTNYLSLAEVQVYAPAASGTDLAFGMGASQSSTLPGFTSAVAASAVDGNTDGAFFDGSVTATNQDPNAWWQVDLGASANLTSIVVWNRTDCCGDRLSDFWVFASNQPFSPSDTPASLQSRAGTFASHQTSAPSPSVTIPATTQARYVRVQLSGTNYLSLAEVQVMGTLTGSSKSDLAVGKAVSRIADPVWEVDLGASANVHSLVLWNRTGCCATRPDDYWVFVSDTPFSPTDTPASLQFRPGTFAAHQTAASSPSTIVPVGVQGRYVRVQSEGAKLNLDRVQVIGQ